MNVLALTFGLCVLATVGFIGGFVAGAISSNNDVPQPKPLGYHIAGYSGGVLVGEWISQHEPDRNSSCVWFEDINGLEMTYCGDFAVTKMELGQ